MKKFSYRFGSAVTFLAGMALVGMLPWSSAQTKPAHASEFPNFDQRAAVVKPAERLVERNAGLNGLKQRLPAAEVSFDGLLDSPRFIHSRKGFLTGANGEGLAVSAQAAQSFAINDPYRAVRAFLNQHAALFGHGEDALANATITRESVGAHNGLRTVVWQQQHAGLPVFGSVLIGNIASKGELVSIGSHFLPNPAVAAGGAASAQAAISSAQAIAAALGNLGQATAEHEVTAAAASENGFQQFNVHNTAAHARLTWLPMNRASLRLAWELYVRDLRTRELFQVLVDAQSGAILVRRNLMRHISDATYNVYTSDSPSPFSPGWPTPNTAQPPLTNRLLVTTAALDTTASPNGWINDGDNESQGNNVDTFVDRDFDQQPDGPRPQGNPTRVFDFPLDLTQAPLSYSNASVVQLFYYINVYHDRLYQLGFTEAFGNFQNDNFGRGGLGNDRIISYVQSGADIGIANNAAFGTPPDGINGEMYMFVLTGPTPDRDSSLDAEVVFHEASHGTSQRLVGGGVLISALQTDGMGEGWGDFIGASLLSEPADDPDAVYASGAYFGFSFFGFTTLPNYYYGDRHYPYSSDLTKNPFTFKDIDPAQILPHTGVPLSPLYAPFNPNEADEVHHQGEVWAATLWTVRANLVNKYGYAGNQLMLQLVIDGMKLGPANPNFLEARDAILLADEVNNGGVNTPEIWAGFAKRGMGVSATSPPSTTTAGVVEAFDVPGLQIDETILSGGNGNGIIDINECNQLDIVLKNNSPLPATGVSVRLSTRTPHVSFGSKISDYLDLVTGATATNLIPFSISTSPNFICGTPIILDVLIKSDQATTSATLTFQTGTNGLPVRFDNSSPAAILDLGSTNSTIVVSNINSAISKVTVALYLNHTYDSDLWLQLISPDGVTNTLSHGNGFSGNDYGAGCTPDNFRTVFDDAAAISITAGNPPFVGSFKPQEALSTYVGKFGTNVNGNWQLRIVDEVGLDVGVLNCWSLFLSPSQCDDGGGGCPGADLAIGMTDVPDPVFVGSNLVYNITLTNFGPSSAKNTVITHHLPPSVLFVSAVCSQGSCVNAGDTVIGHLGVLPMDGKATMTVTVRPTTVGIISSSASATSNEVDPDVANNSATVATHVNPPTADMALGLLSAPNPALVGGSLTYSVSVTNGGPSTASGVMVTNTLSPSVIVQSASASQGITIFTGNVVVFSLGTLTNGGRATGTINVTPTSEGTIIATSVVSANQADPILSNNSRTATTVIGPASDLAIGITDTPDPVVLRSNWTYTVGVTNLGPSVGNNVGVAMSLPSGVNLVSTNTTVGSLSVTGAFITVNLGAMNSGATATITVVVNATNSGTYNAAAAVSSSSADPNLANNNASASTTVAPPTVAVVPAGATLTAESLIVNGAIDVGETVTLTLRLRNAGNVSNTNLTATLLATNGVTAPSGSQNYGVLSPSGVPVGRSFTFTATGVSGGTVSPTLQLQDGASNLGLVAFNFTFPIVQTFANPAAITIPDVGAATPYPSTITVSGVSNLVGRVSVTLSNLNHTFVADVDVLLVGANGQKVMLMSDAGSPNGVINTTATFDDAGATLPQNGQLLATTYAPADYDPGDAFPAPAPVGTYGTSLNAFNGNGANGTWSLFIVDDTSGDAGGVANGWSLALTTITPVNQIADIAVIGAASPNPVLVGNLLTYTFTVTNSGPDVASGVAFTNIVPAGATLVSATASQGGLATNGNTVVAGLGSLSAGASATVTVGVIPNTAGSLVNVATAVAGETDLNPGNNSSSVTTTAILPLADLGISQIASNTVVVGSNIVFTLIVTNNGPQTALGAGITDTLPAGLTFISATPGVGSATNFGATVTASFGNLAAGSSATLSIVANAVTLGSKTNVAVASTTSSDTNAANNSATAIVAVVAPSPNLVPAGATLLSESFAPANGTVEIGETVTVALALQNTGTATTTNLWAILQTSGGVTSASPPQNYGVIVAGGPPVSGSFSFTASGTNGGVVTATLVLDDNGPVGTAIFNFNLPTTTTFANTNAITLPDHGAATPYPSTIAVSGLSGLVSKVTVSLNGITHAFPDDIDVLLVGPTGQKAVVMSDAGGGHSLSNVTVTLDDSFGALPDSGQITTGSYGPADYESGDIFPAPAPAGSAGAVLGAFNGGDANGNWSLYVVDDSSGDGGAIAGGWSLNITTMNPLAPVADLAIAISSAAPNPLYVAYSITNTITVTNRGPSSATGVVVSYNVPDGLNYLSSSGSQGSIGAVGSLVTANVGSLASGGSAQYTVHLSTSLGGDHVNTVTIAGNQSDLNSVNNSASVTTTVIVPQPPRFSDMGVTNGQFQATLTAQAGLHYVVYASTNLTSWTPLSTNLIPANGTAKIIDDSVPTFGQRFYRAVRVIP